MVLRSLRSRIDNNIVVVLALYQPDIHPPQVRATLGPQQINELVEFFLKLGGHYINPVHNNGSPSRKMARWELAGQNPTTFAGRVPGTYPLTAGLERLTVVHRLLATAAFLGNPIPQLHERFTARAYGHDTVNSQWLWQAGGSNPQYVGHGLRSVNWIEAKDASGWFENQGFQPLFLGMGGSYATLLTMFPSQGGVESFFWCTPGVAAMGSDPNRFTVHMAAHAGNTLLTSHFSNFQGFPSYTLVYIP
jgi:hypothetical protein